LFRQVTYEKERMEVNIIYKDGRKEEKVLTRWVHYDPAGEDKVTIVFSKPAREEGLGLFIWRHAKGDDDQWLKLPSMKEVRRISIADQSKYFAGSDITYEDSRQLIQLP
jgi:Outer membrane lipoprotein-sorting protein